jgi:hypothetical protein
MASLGGRALASSATSGQWSGLRMSTGHRSHHRRLLGHDARKTRTVLVDPCQVHTWATIKPLSSPECRFCLRCEARSV